MAFTDLTYKCKHCGKENITKTAGGTTVTRIPCKECKKQNNVRIVNGQIKEVS